MSSKTWTFIVHVFNDTRHTVANLYSILDPCGGLLPLGVASTLMMSPGSRITGGAIRVWKSGSSGRKAYGLLSRLSAPV